MKYGNAVASRWIKILRYKVSLSIKILRFNTQEKNLHKRHYILAENRALSGNNSFKGSGLEYG